MYPPDPPPSIAARGDSPVGIRRSFRAGRALHSLVAENPILIKRIDGWLADCIYLKADRSVPPLFRTKIQILISIDFATHNVTRYSMKPITPGEVLMDDYLDPLGISQNALGRSLGVSPRAINEIVHGRRSITAPMSIRLGAYFRQSPRFWLNVQTECDIRKAMRERKKLTAQIEPIQAVAESPAKYGKQ